MKSLWNDADASPFLNDPAALRAYTSRLLGADPDLVLHGGGNTSVKASAKDFYGDEVEVLYIKGSGWDLATIQPAGFAPVRMEAALRLAKFDALGDADMVRELRAAMLDPDAPTPSIEAIPHAVLPPKYVDHTHADAVVALTNQPNGAEVIREVYGDRVLVIDYVMPGFALAKAMADAAAGGDFSKLEGIILMNHGIFTFADDAKASYERMIKLVTEAEDHLAAKGAAQGVATAEYTPQPEDAVALAKTRKAVCDLRGGATLALWDRGAEAAGFAARPDAADLGTRGPLTPDHTIRTKRLPAVLEGGDAVADYAADYAAYFERNNDGSKQMLDQAPRWAIWPGKGTVSFGASLKDAGIVADIAAHTVKTIQMAEALGGWTALGEKPLFEIEYWELEQAKLRKGGGAPPLQGKIALVTGASAGIGRACAQALHDAGACVAVFDLKPDTPDSWSGDRKHGVAINLTHYDEVKARVDEVVQMWGGIDILVSNAGIFTAGANFEDMEMANWQRSLDVNLTSHMMLLKYCVPYLRHGVDPTAIYIGSRNVAAPGAGAGSYSCAKAAITQLVRVAALELAKEGVRVNIVHPDAVFDTELWTPEVLQRSADRYGMTVDEYKTRNLMKTEIKSADVGNMVVAMAGPAFAKTTGAQVPVDGGNDRVI
ncbi:MAG: bifunctional aldolase/short-chain dehydrogenase [Verrucomicrobiales bacterium]